MKIKTEIMYTNWRGHIHLPFCLQYQELEEGSRILSWDELEHMDENEIDEVKQTIKDIGFNVEYVRDGMFLEIL